MDLKFIDLVVLEKITPDTVMDSFGGQIGSSFFDTAALMGTLQVKGLIAIKPTLGKSIVNKTKMGEDVLKRAAARVEDELDELDHAVLRSIAAGARSFEQIERDLSIKSDDLTYHLNKIVKKGYADYEIKNVKVAFSLSESGFKLTGYVPKTTKAPVEQRPAPTPPGIKPLTPSPVAKPAKPIAPGMPGKEIEAAMLGEEDVTATIPRGERVEITDWMKFKARIPGYLKIIIPVIIIIIVIVLGARYLGYF